MSRPQITGSNLRSINNLHEPSLPLLETPTFHIGDDLSLERYRIILLERHDHRYRETGALGDWQATVDHRSAAAESKRETLHNQ